MNIGFTILGKERDKQDDKKPCSRSFRPSVAFALQREIPLDSVVLGYQTGQEEFLPRMKEYIRDGAQEQGRTVKIEHRLLQFNDAYDYNECFRSIYQALKSITSKPTDQLYVHSATGSHTMQFAMYIIADKQIMPIRLLQTYTDEALKGSNEYGYGHAKEIDLAWTHYTEIVSTLDKQHRQIGEDLLLGLPTQCQKLAATIRDLALIGVKTDDPLLIYGATGTGKTRIAKAIHEMWAATKGQPTSPFMDLNCAGLLPELAQSQLFGHVKGAFTSADRDRDGALALADGGTLFLDEIAELDLKTQAILLKVLDKGKFYRLGDYQKELTTSFRLICATNKDLQQEIAAGRFRDDLFARIRSWLFYLPNLRERQLDLHAQIHYELGLWVRRQKKAAVVTFVPKAEQEYLAFAQLPTSLWTGNFRDLQQSVCRMATLASNQEPKCITPALVRQEMQRLQALWQQPAEEGANDRALGQQLVGKFANAQMCLLDEVENFLRNYALEQCHHNKAEAGRWLYEIAGQELSNPTAKFNQRGKRLGQD